MLQKNWYFPRNFFYFKLKETEFALFIVTRSKQETFVGLVQNPQFYDKSHKSLDICDFMTKKITFLWKKVTESTILQHLKLNLNV